MPLNIRDHSYLLGETAMTVWFTKYGISQGRLEDGMTLVREETAEFMKEVPLYEMAPSTVNPIEKGVTYAEKPDDGFYFAIGAIRDFDAVVKATTLMVMVAAMASEQYAPIEELQKTVSNIIGTNRGPLRE